MTLRHGGICWVCACLLTPAVQSLAWGESLLPTAVSAPASQPVATTGRSSTEPGKEQINQAVLRLGSASYSAREEAQQWLWGIGAPAVPALKQAANSDDPETSCRARAILGNLAMDVHPDTPPKVLDLVQQFHSSDPEQRTQAIMALPSKGLAGARVLMRLAADHQQTEVRHLAIHALMGDVHGFASSFVAEGDLDAARQLLQLLAPQSEAVTRDWAAFLLIHGGIGDEISRLERARQDHAQSSEGLSPAVQLAYFYRARGDLSAARAIAESDGNNPLLEALMVEQGDWKGLAERISARGVGAGSIEDLGYLMAFNRLAGNAGAADQLAKQIVEFADQHPTDHVDAAEALFLNDRPKLAIDVLKKQKNYALAISYLTARLQPVDAIALWREAKSGGLHDLPLITANAAAAWQLMGKYADARDAIETDQKGADGPLDLPATVTLLQMMSTLQQREKILSALALWLQDAGQHDQEVMLFQAAGFIRPEQAAQWWDAMQQRKGKSSNDQKIAKLWAVQRGELSEKELDELIAEARGWAARMRPMQREQLIVLISDTLDHAHRTAEAIETLETLAPANRSGEGWTRLGDLYAEGRQWDKAAAAYGHAFDRDHSQAAPLLLRGWALTQAGRTIEGRETIDRAQLMALADDGERHTLETLLTQHGLADDAARDRELILRTGDINGWQRCDALRRDAMIVNAKGDHARAADLWNRAFLGNLSTRMRFTEDAANLMIPVLIHRVRGQAAIQAGRFDEAVKEAAVCLDHCAGDADSQIAIINDLDAAGHRELAEGVYARGKAVYGKLATDFPKSGPANNLLAWYEARCKHDLDDAVAHAQRGVEAEPGNAAILDTLAEAHYQRGEVDIALDLARQCLKLEPHSAHHMENVKRFEAAKAAQPTTRRAQ